MGRHVFPRASECLRWSDVDYDENALAVKVRREMEAAFGRPNEAGDPSPG